MSAIVTARPRVVGWIDPGKTKRSGLAAWEIGRGLVRAEAVAIQHAAFTENDAIAALERLIGPDADWLIGCERPPPVKKGRKSAPIFAFDYWRRVVLLFARTRCASADVPYRIPMVLTPYPSEARAPLGIPTCAPRHLRLGPADAADWVKARAKERLFKVHGGALERMRAEGVDVDQPDIIDACVGAWWVGERVVAYGKWWSPGSKKPPEDIRWAA